MSWVIESSKIGWARHAARMGGGGEVHRGIWWGNLKSRDDLKFLGGKGCINWIFKKYVCSFVSWIDLAEYVDA